MTTRYVSLAIAFTLGQFIYIFFAKPEEKPRSVFEVAVERSFFGNFTIFMAWWLCAK